MQSKVTKAIKKQNRNKTIKSFILGGTRLPSLKVIQTILLILIVINLYKLENKIILLLENLCQIILKTFIME